MTDHRKGTALSLRPGQEVVEACAFGNRYARAIAEAWKFRFPIRCVTPEEFAKLCEDGTVFHD